jgi:predicted amidohydrolase
MKRIITVGAAQLGPIQREHTREQVVTRLIALLRLAHSAGCDLVVFPELALTTFFPRWFVENISETDHFYETQMPSPITARKSHCGMAISISDGMKYARTMF